MENSLKPSTQVKYNCNTKFSFLYCSCIALVWTHAIQRCNTSFLQLAENLQDTCSSCKKTCITAVLHLCGLLQYNKIPGDAQKTSQTFAGVIQQCY